MFAVVWLLPSVAVLLPVAACNVARSNLPGHVLASTRSAATRLSAAAARLLPACSGPCTGVNRYVRRHCNATLWCPVLRSAFLFTFAHMLAHSGAPGLLPSCCSVVMHRHCSALPDNSGVDSALRGVHCTAVSLPGAHGVRAAGDANAWRLLGAAHAENDDDRQAIAAMLRALEAAPGSPDVLLALGVSHVNELHEGEAVDYLMQCAPPSCCSKFQVQL